MAASLSSLAGVVLAASGCGPEIDRAAERVASVSEQVTVCAHGPVIQGVDVSHWDGAIDWVEAHGDGIEFAIAKATEADDFVDDTFATNRQQAKAAGVAFGAYHFFRADVDPTVQANHFLSIVGAVEPGEISPTIDVETTDGQSGAVIAQRALTFLQVVESQTGRVPMIYTSPSFFNSTLDAPTAFGDYLLWIANWEVTCPDVPGAWSDWTVWQRADDGTVAGIASAADLDEFDGTVAELQCAGVKCSSGSCKAGECGGGAAGGAGGEGAGAAGGEGDGGALGAAGPDIEVTGGVPGQDSGCGCHAAPASSSPGALLGAGLAAAALRRRRLGERRGSDIRS